MGLGVCAVDEQMSNDREVAVSNLLLAGLFFIIIIIFIFLFSLGFATFLNHWNVSSQVSQKDAFLPAM